MHWLAVEHGVCRIMCLWRESLSADADAAAVSAAAQVKYVLSDKTGTLTQNVMGFVWASIGGTLYGKNAGRDGMAPGDVPMNTPHRWALLPVCSIPLTPCTDAPCPCCVASPRYHVFIRGLQ
jgi:hypothetical protein